MLGHHWEKAEATVVARNVRVQAAGYQPSYEFVVEVRPSSRPPLRATIHEGFRAPDGGFANPSVGDVVGVLYDPRSQHVKFDNSDPRLSGAFAGAVVAAATPPVDALTQMKPSAGEPSAPTADPAERLAKLQSLKDSGVLTEAEYASQRQKIINEI